MVLTWSKRKKYSENSYKETKLVIKLRHVSIECVTVCGHARCLCFLTILVKGQGPSSHKHAYSEFNLTTLYFAREEEVNS